MARNLLGMNILEFDLSINFSPHLLSYTKRTKWCASSLKSRAMRGYERERERERAGGSLIVFPHKKQMFIMNDKATEIAGWNSELL